MEFSRRYHYINAGSKFQGILKHAIVREFDEFQVLLELYRIQSNDPPVLNKVSEECYRESTRLQVLDKVSTQLDDSIYATYIEIEQYLPGLKHQITKIHEQQVDENKLYNFQLINKMNIVLNVWQIKRFYADLKSFYESYMILDSMFNMFKQNLLQDDQQDKSSIKDHQSTKLNNKNNEEPKSIKDVVSQPSKVPSSDELTQVDKIIDFCLNSLVMTSLIHQVFTYYQYDNSSKITKDENGKIIVNCIKVLPTNYIFNTNYFKQMVFSLSKVSMNKIELYIKKILSSLKEEEFHDKSVYIMMMSYLLLIYYLRIISETHGSYLYSKFDEILNSNSLQTRFFNYYTNQYGFNDIEFKIKTIDIDSDYESTLEDLSSQYSHLISVDQEKFADLIFQQVDKENVEQKLPDDFNMTKSSVINLEKLADINQFSSKKEKLLESSVLFDPESLISTSDDDLISHLFKFKRTDNGKISTDAYEELLEYINNPNHFMLIKNIPETVKNLFPTLKSILTPSIFDKHNVNTLSYYIILTNQIENPRIISHITFLYVVYQIILPYMNDLYGITVFEDQLI